jgi:hypothetical protein
MHPKFFSEAQLDIRLQALLETIDARRENEVARMLLWAQS